MKKSNFQYKSCEQAHTIIEVKNMKRYRDEDDYPIFSDDYGIGASSYDMTGLIPSAPETDEEADAYGDIYPYRADEEM